MKTLRCSELDRELLCNGSLTLVPRVTKRKGDEGVEGSWLHWTGHNTLKELHGASGEIGPTPEVPKTINFCQWISDYYVRTVTETVPQSWSLECEVALAYEFGRFILSGHIDCVAINADATEAIGFDLKTGYDPVDPADFNEQLFGYIVLLLQAYPSLRKITFYIVQPRNDEDEGFQRVSSVTLEGATVANAEATLVRRINAALDNAMEVETSMKACKWCSAAMQCPAQLKLKEEMKATLTPEYLETLKATPDDGALVRWVMDAKSLNRPMEDATDMLKERIKANGSAVGGDGTLVTIKQEGGSYSFPNPGEFYRAQRRLLPDDDVYAATVKPSVTKIKDALAETRGIPKSSKKGDSAASVFAAELGHLCEQGTRERLVFQTP